MGAPPRYRIEDGVHCVDVRLNSIEQLFDNRDPAPFRQRDLDPDLVEYLFAAGEDLSSLGTFKVVVWVAQPCSAEEIETGYRAHFDYEIERLVRRRRRHRRTGQIALLIGVTILVVLLSVAELLDDASRLTRVTREGLVILSWIVMWRPVEALIYDWVPLRRERRVMQRLRAANVEVRSGKGPA